MNQIIHATLCACTALGLLLVNTNAARAKDGADLLPAPQFQQWEGGDYALLPGSHLQVPEQTRVSATARWFTDTLRETTGLELSVAPAEMQAITLELVDSGTLRQRFAANGLAPGEAQLTEAYSLNISHSGVEISAVGTAGIQHGLSSLLQLIASAEESTNGVQLPHGQILDAPEFVWRGLMLDSARHFQSVDYILQLLDWMALHKLNSFHWHLTDDQAWRLEIKAYPLLTEIGAFRVPAGQAPAADIDPATGKPRLYGAYYTQEDVRRVVAHATERHIQVVPEVDVPGHGTAAIVAYPELGIDGYVLDEVPANWGVYHNVFNLEESTFQFFEQVLDEVVSLFPGPFIHLGGDEVVTEQWEASPRVAERIDELGIDALQGVQNYFVERLQGHLDQYERRVIGWDEVLESELPPHAVVMSWRGVDGAIEAAAKQHQTVLSPAPTLYLDHIQTAAADAPPGRGGVISIRDIYEFDPLPERLEENRDMVLGLQANIWTEHIRTQARAQYMTWPRAIALAEVAWTPSAKRDFEGFRDRLQNHLPLLDGLGMGYARDAQALTGDPLPAAMDPMMREDRELELCSDAIVLALEDDAPLEGERESYLVDIMNPCWIWRDAPLAKATAISASVGQLPFNFEIGALIEDVRNVKPETENGELLVRLENCEGPVIAQLPLGEAVNHFAATQLSAAPITGTPGTPETADLCMQFRSHGFDPFWVLDWLRLESSP